MAIIKIIKRENPYIQIDKTGINDNRLSWGASGLLTYLIGRPDNWNINLNHLATVKDKDKKDKTRGYLNELREFEYCHYFEVRKGGRIIQNFYLVFEVPTKYEEILENFIEIPEDCVIRHREVSKQKDEVKIEKSIENKEVLPRLENPTSVITTSVNPTLLIKEYTKERNTNNRTTTKDTKNDLEKDKKISSSYDFLDKNISVNPTLLIKEYTKERNTNNRTTTKDTKNDLEKDKKISSSYDFLDKNIFSLLNNATKKNIRKNIKDLTEEKFTEIYNLTLGYIKSGKGQNFNAILYKGLNNEWEYTSCNLNIKSEEPKPLEESKRKWLSYFAGIITDQNLKNEVENIIKDITIEVLNINKSLLAKMNIFEFKQHLYTLRKSC